MPRRPRQFTGSFVFHVLNRAVQGVTLFNRPGDYEAYFEILVEAQRRFPIQVLAYCIMPNHWHFVVQPETDDSLSPFMHRLSSRHAMQWRGARHSRGRGAVYQSRFKAIAVQHDAYFARLCLYVNRNAVRAGLASHARNWPWSSASPLASGPNRPVLAEWPVSRPSDWDDLLDLPEPEGDLEQLRSAIRAGQHLGSEEWRLRTAMILGWPRGLRPPGRPPKAAAAAPTGGQAAERAAGRPAACN